MITDDERREVALKLRSARYGWHNWERALYDALGVDTETAGLDMLDRLADLIEPSEPKVRCVAEAKVDGERLEKLVHDAAVELTGIDRDALLELANDADRSATELLKANNLDPNRKRRSMRRKHAQDLMVMSSRIREALGYRDDVMEVKK